MTKQPISFDSVKDWHEAYPGTKEFIKYEDDAQAVNQLMIMLGGNFLTRSRLKRELIKDALLGKTVHAVKRNGWAVDCVELIEPGYSDLFIVDYLNVAPKGGKHGWRARVVHVFANDISKMFAQFKLHLDERRAIHSERNSFYRARVKDVAKKHGLTIKALKEKNSAIDAYNEEQQKKYDLRCVTLFASTMGQEYNPLFRSHVVAMQKLREQIAFPELKTRLS